MISSVLGAGLGHTVRSLAIEEQFCRYSNVKFNFVVPYSNMEYVKQNIKSNRNIGIYNFCQMEDFARKEERHEETVIKEMRNTDILLNDFYALIPTSMALFKDSLRLSLIHGSVIEYAKDNQEVRHFKQFILNALKEYHVFFHINLTRPTSKPKIRCQYIPIPIVGRSANIPKERVKEFLGLKNEEEFILFHIGAGTDRTMYRFVNEFYQQINNLDLDYRIVVADNLAGANFRFNDNIIKAPFFVNGMDLVQASEMVVTKPGMGIVQDCIMADKPILFTPADGAERMLKIELMRELLNDEMPVIKKLESEQIKEAISECLDMKETYLKKYSKIPKNGAEIMAKSLALFTVAGKKYYKDVIPLVKKLTPFLN